MTLQQRLSKRFYGWARRLDPKEPEEVSSMRQERDRLAERLSLKERECSELRIETMTARRRADDAFRIQSECQLAEDAMSHVCDEAERMRDDANIARDKAIEERNAAISSQAETESLYDKSAREFDDKVESLKTRIKELEDQLVDERLYFEKEKERWWKQICDQSASAKSARMQAKASEARMIRLNTCEEGFADESLDHVLIALKAYHKTLGVDCRNERHKVIIGQIIALNRAPGEVERRSAAVRSLIANAGFHIDSSVFKSLERYGVTLADDKQHWKVRYMGLSMPLAKTPSDSHARANGASDLSHKFFL